LRAIHGSEAAGALAGRGRGELQGAGLHAERRLRGAGRSALRRHYTTFISPQPFGLLFSVRLVTMVVVGGLASHLGAVFGTASLTF